MGSLEELPTLKFNYVKILSSFVCKIQNYDSRFTIFHVSQKGGVEMSVNFYRTTRRHIPEDSTFLSCIYHLEVFDEFSLNKFEILDNSQDISFVINPLGKSWSFVKTAHENKHKKERILACVISSAGRNIGGDLKGSIDLMSVNFSFM
jgi:hypothetical protein